MSHILGCHWYWEICENRRKKKNLIPLSNFLHFVYSNLWHELFTVFVTHNFLYREVSWPQSPLSCIHTDKDPFFLFSFKTILFTRVIMALPSKIFDNVFHICRSHCHMTCMKDRQLLNIFLTLEVLSLLCIRCEKWLYLCKGFICETHYRFCHITIFTWVNEYYNDFRCVNMYLCFHIFLKVY